MARGGYGTGGWHVLLKVLVVILPAWAPPVIAVDRSADGWSDIVRAELAAGRPLPLLSGFIADAPLELAYAIQEALVFAPTPRPAIAGYKGGFTSRAAQQRFGLVAPVSGILLKGGERRGGAVIALPANGRLLLELEFGFRLRSAITRPMNSVADLKTYVRAVMPVVEVPRLRFAEDAAFTGFDLVATNVGAETWVAGDPLPLRDPAQVNELTCSLHRDGEAVDEGAATAAMGDQLEALLWLVNHVHARGLPLRPETLLITGTLGKLNPAAPGAYSVSCGGALVEFTVTAGAARARP